MTKAALGITGAVALGVLAYAVFTLSPTPSNDYKPDAAATAAAPDTATPPTGPASYTLADVAKHNSVSSCWAAINGNVYDLTGWIFQHPGGPEHIEAICGTDATAAFNAQHSGQRAPAQELATFLIGTLNQ